MRAAFRTFQYNINKSPFEYKDFTDCRIPHCPPVDRCWGQGGAAFDGWSSGISRDVGASRFDL